MSPGEAAWRLRQKARASRQRVFRKRSFRVAGVGEILGDARIESACHPAALGRHLHRPSGQLTADEKTLWLPLLVARADRIVAHRLDLFDLPGIDLGPKIQWNYEYKAGRPTPMGLASTIDYRDYRVTGDCKFIWELNRHHHLVVLARAYYATGEHRYAAEVVDQLESWIEQCPYGYGMNWRSPLELSIRLINWVWSLELIRASGLLTATRWRRILPVVYAHLSQIARQYSRYSSANNHLIGEAAGVFIACSYFRGLRRAETWRAAARDILAGEIIRQTHADGGTREQAMGYQLFVMELLLLCGVTVKSCGDDFSDEYWKRLEKMFEFLHGFVEGGPLPPIGDADDGYVLDLGDRDHRRESLLCLGATAFQRPEWTACSSSVPESAFWLLGTHAKETTATVERDALQSRAFPDSGYYLLQCGRAQDRVSVVFDCGPLGFLSTAAHGHADALSVTLRLGGQDVLLDCGTYDYFTYPSWRDYFRSTRAHNTATVDGFDSSEMLGPFLWGRRADCRRLAWEPSAEGGRVCAEHGGYTRLADPVIHRRAVSVDGTHGRLEVEDEFVCKGDHAVAIYWHVPLECRLNRTGDGRLELSVGDRTLTVEFDGRLRTDVGSGDESSIRGWVSDGYHRKAACRTIVGLASISGTTTFTTRILYSRSEAQVPQSPRDGAPRQLASDAARPATVLGRRTMVEGAP